MSRYFNDPQDELDDDGDDAAVVDRDDGPDYWDAEPCDFAASAAEDRWVADRDMSASQ